MTDAARVQKLSGNYSYILKSDALNLLRLQRQRMMRKASKLTRYRADLSSNLMIADPKGNFVLRGDILQAWGEK